MKNYETVYKLIKGLVGFVINKLVNEIKSGSCEQEKLIACTYMLYVVLYEEVDLFDKDNT